MKLTAKLFLCIGCLSLVVVLRLILRTVAIAGMSAAILPLLLIWAGMLSGLATLVIGQLLVLARAPAWPATSVSKPRFQDRKHLESRGAFTWVLVKRTIATLSMLVAAATYQSAHGQLPTSAVKDEEPVQAQFAMGPRYAYIPEGYFLLIRKGTALGAIRLVSIHQDTLGNGSSTYESYFQSDGSGSFLTATVVRRAGKIDIRPLVGLHPFNWQPGQDRLRVGDWWFGCPTPSLVNMSGHFAVKDQGYEFAPTSAKDIHEVDALDKRLKWFRYDENTEVIMPVASLPK